MMNNNPKKHWLSLRKKAIASILLIYVLLMVYFLYFTVINQHRHAEEEMINAAETQAKLISLAISAHLLPQEEIFLQGFVKEATKSRDIEYIRIVLD